MKSFVLVGLLFGACCNASVVNENPDPGTWPAAPQGITEANLLRHIKTLASDEFEGRAPGTHGEQLAIDYISEQFRQGGLLPGNPDGTFLQAVPLVGIKSSVNGSITIGGKKTPLQSPADYVARSYWLQPEIMVGNSGVIFAGFGIVAPEFGWDDFKNVEVRGKIVVLIDGEPVPADPRDPTQPDASMFQGRAQTFYGTSAYKYQAAALRGAAAVFIVHDPDTAFASFAVMQNNYRQESFDLRSSIPSQRHAAVEGRLTIETFQRLGDATPLDFARLKKAAQSRDFVPVVLAATAEFAVRNEVREIVSHNVLARVRGSDPRLKDEVVIYTAHWDHLGRDPSLPGDQIFNGAIDNAAGVAQLLEIAAAFARAPVHPKRSLLFIATTAEEKGYLGARYYLTHPFFPLPRTLANINLDNSNLWGRTSDTLNLGYGLTTLDTVLADAARTQDRTFLAQPASGGIYFFLSDQIEFARAGIPAVFPGAGSAYRGKPAEYGDRKWEEYGAKHYHQVSDEVQPDWDLSGTVEDVQWLWLTGYQTAQAAKAPDWKPGAGFARRDR